MSDPRLVLVTRPAGGADPLVAALRAGGLRVTAVPTIATVPADPGGPLDEAVSRLGGWDWIAVTSVAAAAAVGAAARSVGHDLALSAPPPRWAAVGATTARALAAEGVRVDLVANRSGGLGLARALAQSGTLGGANVLLPRTDAADAELPTALRAAHAIVTEVIAYRTQEAPDASAAGIADALTDPDLAACVVASGSAVRGLLRLAALASLADAALWTPLVSIGPTTSSVARAMGFRRIVEARQPSVDGLVEAVRGAIHLDVVAHPPLEARR